MLIREVIELFLYNRRNGLAGSKGRAATKTLVSYEYSLRPFRDYMESRDKFTYSEVGIVDVRAYVEFINDLLSKKTWSRSRWLLAVKVLKMMSRFIEEDEDCKEAGLKSFKSKLPIGGAFPKRDYIPSPQDLKKWKKAFNLSTVIGLRNWTMFCILMETGIRRSELAALKLEHFQLENHQIYVPDGKTGSRTIAITEILARNIRIYMKKRQKAKFSASPYMFASYKSPIPTGDMITKVFAGMRKELNLPYCTPHTMRHAFCTFYLSRGGSTERLRMMTGHKTYGALLHYMHLAKVSGPGQKEELERVSPLTMLDEV